MSKRFYYIDSLRAIAIVMMFVYHISMVFAANWDWHIKDTEGSYMLLELNFWMSSFRMPLLFFVSGYISYILMKRMSVKSFSIQRFNRLIIPTVIWTFLLVAPQIYFERKIQGSELTYLEFYKTFFQFELYPNGNFHWLHLWFIPYLFCYNLLSIPLFRFLENSNRLNIFFNSFFKRTSALFLLVLIAIIPYTFLTVHYDASYDLVNDIARHSFFTFFVFTGLLFFKFQKATENIEKRRRLFLTCALLSIIGINIIRWNGWEPFNLWDNWMTKSQTYLYNALLNFNTWMWVFVSLGYGKMYLNKGSKVLNYANTAIYPFYILHQTVIVIIAYYVVQTPDALYLKFLFLIWVCFFITILIYHLFIRPYNPIRFLFGMKALNKEKTEFINQKNI